MHIPWISHIHHQPLIMIENTSELQSATASTRHNHRMLTKDLIHSVCDGNYRRFVKLVRLGADINCSIEDYTLNCIALKRIVPFYTVGGMSERRRPMSLLALSTTLQRSDITQFCVKKRMETVLKPLSSEDMLWVIDHSTVRNFEIICREFGESFVNDTICFERTAAPIFDDGELLEPQTETVRTSATRVMVNSMRIWRDIDSFYASVRPSKQSSQVRKLMYLIKSGGKLDWDGGVDRQGLSLLCTLITEDESYAVDMLLNWKVVTCKSHESIAYIDHCVYLNHKAILVRLLREPTMQLPINPCPPQYLISQSWISDTTPVNGEKLTEIIMQHNYTFHHTDRHMLSINDTTKRIALLYNGGVCISDPNSILNNAHKLDFTHPGLDVHTIRCAIRVSQTPRMLLGLARLVVKQSIGPCKTGHFQRKVGSLPIPQLMKKYITRV